MSLLTEVLKPKQVMATRLGAEVAQTWRRPTVVRLSAKLRRLDNPLSKTRESKVRRWPQFAHICASYGLGS